MDKKLDKFGVLCIPCVTFQTNFIDDGFFVVRSSCSSTSIDTHG